MVRENELKIFNAFTLGWYTLHDWVQWPYIVRGYPIPTHQLFVLHVVDCNYYFNRSKIKYVQLLPTCIEAVGANAIYVLNTRFRKIPILYDKMEKFERLENSNTIIIAATRLSTAWPIIEFTKTLNNWNLGVNVFLNVHYRLYKNCIRSIFMYIICMKYSGIFTTLYHNFYFLHAYV